MKTILVCLDGGTESGWQDKVMAAFEDLVREGVVTFYDPRKNPKEDEENWKKTDIMFIYSESSDVCMILVRDLMPKSLENPEQTDRERWYKEATSLAEGIDILKNEIDAMIIRKSAS